MQKLTLAEYTPLEAGTFSCPQWQLDGQWLDEFLDELAPGRQIKGLIAPMLSYFTNPAEREVMLERLLPEPGFSTLCPILICPDDLDLSCTVVLAQVMHAGDEIYWERFGFDRSKGGPESIGSEVEWFEDIPEIFFNTEEYAMVVKQVWEG